MVIFRTVLMWLHQNTDRVRHIVRFFPKQKLNKYLRTQPTLADTALTRCWLLFLSMQLEGTTRTIVAAIG